MIRNTIFIQALFLTSLVSANAGAAASSVCGDIFKPAASATRIEFTAFIRFDSFEKVRPYLGKSLEFTVRNEIDFEEKNVATNQMVRTLSAFSKRKRRLIRDILTESTSDASRKLWTEMQGEIGVFRKVARTETGYLVEDGVTLDQLKARGLNFHSAGQLSALAHFNFTFDWSREVGRAFDFDRVLQLRQRGKITPGAVVLPAPSVFRGIEIAQIFLRHADGKIQILTMTSGDANEIDYAVEMVVGTVQVIDNESNPITEIDVFHNHPADILSPLSGGDARASRLIRIGLNSLGRTDIVLRTHAVQKLDGTIFIYSAQY